MHTTMKPSHPPSRAPIEGILLTEDHIRQEYFVTINSWTVSKADIHTTLVEIERKGYVLLDEEETPAVVLDGGWVRIWLTTDRWEMMCH